MATGAYVPLCFRSLVLLLLTTVPGILGQQGIVYIATVALDVLAS